MRLALVLALAALASVAGAAELPSRAAKAKPEEKLRTCEIGGEQGVLLDNGTCLRISGYISAGVTGGNVRR